MRRMVLGVAAATVLAVGLGCGGSAGEALLEAGGGSSVGEFASSMAEHLEGEHPDVPAPTYNVGEEFVVGDFTLRLDEAIKVNGETSREHVVPYDVTHFTQEGMKALVLMYSIKNNTPMAKGENLNANCITTDGEKSRFWIHQERLIWKNTDAEELSGKLPPGEWVQTATVCAGVESALDGAVWRPYYKTREYDPTDPRGKRKIDVLHAQAVVDVGTPRDGGELGSL